MNCSRELTGWRHRWIKRMPSQSLSKLATRSRRPHRHRAHRSRRHGVIVVADLFAVGNLLILVYCERTRLIVAGRSAYHFAELPPNFISPPGWENQTLLPAVGDGTFSLSCVVNWRCRRAFMGRKPAWFGKFRALFMCEKRVQRQRVDRNTCRRNDGEEDERSRSQVSGKVAVGRVVIAC
jgi:hypothetical protein